MGELNIRTFVRFKKKRGTIIFKLFMLVFSLQKKVNATTINFKLWLTSRQVFALP